GLSYYDLIIAEEIAVVYVDVTQYGLGVTEVGAFWQGTFYNTIYINELMRTYAPEPAVAALIAHEATHADYDYEPQKWIDLTLQQHPELTASDVHAPGNSIDQEYNAFRSQVSVWNETKGSYTDSNNEGWAHYYAQGESYMKSQIRQAYADQTLPEY
ncbi:MAG: hypothetical protein V1863_00410, partial [Candidatus Omnitrophota bacterium]